MSTPVVFLSYSHDSPEHRAAVLKLSNRLRADGCETFLDQYVNGTPSEKWPRWMLNGVERATHVLCICTPTYYRRFRGHEEPGKGKGADWEGAIITQEIYDSRSHGTKFIPVLFTGTSDSTIPEPLRGATHYRMEADYEAMYDAILGQGGVEPPPVGTPRIKARAGADVPIVGSPAAEVPQASPPEPNEAELAEVFAQTIEDMETLLKAAPDTVKFLGPDAGNGRLISQTGGRWAVLPQFRAGGADVTPVLESMWKRRTTFYGPRFQWDAWEQIIGGVLVLGLDARWVWYQRQIYQSQPVLHPPRAEVLTVEKGASAKFLPVLATAISGGITRIERVFGPLDEKCLPDLSRAMPDVTSEGHAAEMKRHFIRYVLKPSDEINVDALEGEALDTFFDRVRQVLRIADKIDRDPFFAAGANLTRLAKEVKQHMELSDLCLFIPADSGDESDLMTDPVIALTLAKRLSDFIATQRPNI
jgi:hypothetical protein